MVVIGTARKRLVGYRQTGVGALCRLFTFSAATDIARKYIFFLVEIWFSDFWFDPEGPLNV